MNDDDSRVSIGRQAKEKLGFLLSVCLLSRDRGFFCVEDISMMYIALSGESGFPCVVEWNKGAVEGIDLCVCVC